MFLLNGWFFEPLILSCAENPASGWDDKIVFL